MSEQRQDTQKAQIRTHFVNGGTLTPLDALNQYGCFRLASVVHTLRQDGYAINTEIVNSGGKRYAKYSM